MKLLLIKVGLLDKDGQYTEIKVTKSVKTKQIKNNTIGQEKEISSRTLTSIATLATLANLSNLLFLKNDNQRSVALAHNPIFYTRTKHIDI